MLILATHVTLWCNCVSVECIVQGKNSQFSEFVKDYNKQVGRRFVGFDEYTMKRNLS